MRSSSWRELRNACSSDGADGDGAEFTTKHLDKTSVLQTADGYLRSGSFGLFGFFTEFGLLAATYLSRGIGS